jgi:hypothetical protein
VFPSHLLRLALVGIEAQTLDPLDYYNSDVFAMVYSSKAKTVPSHMEMNIFPPFSPVYASITEVKACFISDRVIILDIGLNHSAW